jgi:peptidoglycan-associated lipoprotein
MMTRPNVKACMLVSSLAIVAAAPAAWAATAEVSSEAIPANNPSLRHNPAALDQAGAAAKASIQPGVAPSQLQERHAYFDFERSDLHTEDLPMLRVHANYLLANPQARVKLVGHADQRGGVVYNRVLAEERAKAVRAYFAAQGIPASHIDVESVGRADPATSKNTEPAMAKYRRVDIEYL